MNARMIKLFHWNFFRFQLPYYQGLSYFNFIKNPPNNGQIPKVRPTEQFKTLRIKEKSGNLNDAVQINHMIMNSNDLKDLENIMEKFSEKMSIVNLSTVLRKVELLNTSDQDYSLSREEKDEIVLALTKAIFLNLVQKGIFRPNLNDANIARCVSSIFRSLSFIGERSPHLLSQIDIFQEFLLQLFEIAQSLIGNMNDIEKAVFSLSIVKLGVLTDFKPLWQKIETEMADVADPKTLLMYWALLLRALAITEEPSPSLLNQVDQIIKQKLKNELSNMKDQIEVLHIYSKLSKRIDQSQMKELLDIVFSQLAQNIEHLRMMEMGIIINSLINIMNESQIVKQYVVSQNDHFFGPLEIQLEQCVTEASGRILSYYSRSLPYYGNPKLHQKFYESIIKSFMQDLDQLQNFSSQPLKTVIFDDDTDNEFIEQKKFLNQNTIATLFYASANDLKHTSQNQIFSLVEEIIMHIYERKTFFTPKNLEFMIYSMQKISDQHKPTEKTIEYFNIQITTRIGEFSEFQLDSLLKHGDQIINQISQMTILLEKLQFLDQVSPNIYNIIELKKIILALQTLVGQNHQFYHQNQQQVQTALSSLLKYLNQKSPQNQEEQVKELERVIQITILIDNVDSSEVNVQKLIQFVQKSDLFNKSKILKQKFEIKLDELYIKHCSSN